jgi:hypothetical protein
MMGGMGLLFEQRADESDDNFAWFVDYRDNGGTTGDVAIRQNLSPWTVQRASAQYQWVARREAWRRHLEQISRESAEESAGAIAREHLRLWRGVREWCEQSINAAIARGEELPAAEAIKLAAIAGDKERTIGDLPIGKIEGGLSAEVLAILRGISE